VVTLHPTPWRADADGPVADASGIAHAQGQLDEVVLALGPVQMADDFSGGGVDPGLVRRDPRTERERLMRSCPTA
jgi:hypothetical protein